MAVPELTRLQIDGHGDPNQSPAYLTAVQALYTAGYGVRAAVKGRTGEGFVVGPLEGMWWADDPSDFVARNKHRWSWTMLICLPPWLVQADLDAGLASAAAAKPGLPIDRLSVVRVTEGRCLQRLHIGSYDAEGPVLAELHQQLMPEQGLDFAGPHHEIYLSDPRRTSPQKLRTVLRQPVSARTADLA